MGSNIQYTVLVLKDSLIFMKAGGQFADFGGATITGAVLGGAIGGLIGSAIDKKRRQSQIIKTDDKIAQLREMTAAQIVELNKENFMLARSDIDNLILKKSSGSLGYGPRSGIFTVTQPGQKAQNYDLSVKSGFDETLELVKQALPDKLQVIS
jgi:hypothetical protein